MPDATPSPFATSRIATMWAIGVLIPALGVAALVFGWRCGGAFALVVGSAIITAMVCQRIGLRGRQVDVLNVALHALLLATLLPADLFGGEGWPLLATGGMLVAGWTWIVGGAGMGRPHPVLLAFVTLWAVVAIHNQVDLTPRHVLERQHALVGDLLDASWREPTIQAAPRWQDRPPHPNHNAMRLSPAAEALQHYTTGQHAGWMDLGGMLREKMPSMRDMVLLGQPTMPIAASGGMVLLAGLVLIYAGRQKLWFAALAIAMAYAALVLLPVPVVIRETGAEFRWLAMTDVGWPIGLTLVHYELFAGSILPCVLVLCTLPGVSPRLALPRAVFAMSFGMLAAASQLYVSVIAGPLLLLLLCSLASPMLDRFIGRP